MTDEELRTIITAITEAKHRNCDECGKPHEGNCLIDGRTIVCDKCRRQKRSISPIR